MCSDNLYLSDYRRDGVVLIRSSFDNYVQLIQKAVPDLKTLMPPLWGNNAAVEIDPNFDNILFPYFYSAAIRTFLSESPIGAIAGALLQAEKVRLLFDQIIIRRPGSRKRTSVHQDLPHVPISGRQSCSFWIPLSKVTAEDGPLHYLLGSHRLGGLYSNFEPHGLPDFDSGAFSNSKTGSWELNCGDCLVHDLRTIHWSGECAGAHHRSVYIAVMVGEDETFKIRPASMSFPIDLELKEGDQIQGPLFPEIWQRAPSFHSL